MVSSEWPFEGHSCLRAPPSAPACCSVPNAACLPRGSGSKEDGRLTETCPSGCSREGVLPGRACPPSQGSAGPVCKGPAGRCLSLRDRSPPPPPRQWVSERACSGRGHGAFYLQKQVQAQASGRPPCAHHRAWVAPRAVQPGFVADGTAGECAGQAPGQGARTVGPQAPFPRVHVAEGPRGRAGRCGLVRSCRVVPVSSRRSVAPGHVLSCSPLGSKGRVHCQARLALRVCAGPGSGGTRLSWRRRPLSPPSRLGCCLPRVLSGRPSGPHLRLPPWLEADMGRRGAAVSLPLSPELSERRSGPPWDAPFLQLEVCLGSRPTPPSGGPCGPGDSRSPRVPPLSQSESQHVPTRWHFLPALCVFGPHSAP